MSRLSKNIIYNIVGQSLVLILGFISVKYVYSQLGGDIVGIIYFAVMVNSILCMTLELGICSTTVREVSAHYETDSLYTQEFIRVFSSFYWILYVVFGVLIYLFAPVLVEKWLNLHHVDSATTEYALRVLLISSLLALPKSFYASIIRGLQRMKINNVIDAVTVGVQQIGIIIIILKGGNLIHVAYWIATTHLLSLIAFIVACARFFPSHKTLIPGYSRSIIERNLQYTAQMTVISLTALAYLQADKVILSKILPIDTFGYYYFAYSLVAKGALVTMAISHAVFPHVSNIYGTGDRNAMQKQYHKLQNMLCFLIVPVFAAISFASLPLFSYLFNEDIARTLLLPITLLCIGFYMTGTLTIPNNISFVVGKPNIVVRQNLLAIFMVLPVTFLSIRMWGMVGASLSNVVYSLFCYFYSIPRICDECIGMPAKKWHVHILRIYCLVGLTYGVAYIILNLINDFRVYSLLTAYGISTVLLLTGSYYLIGDELKRTIARFYYSVRLGRSSRRVISHAK